MKTRSSTYRYIALTLMVLLFLPLLVNHLPGIPKAHVFGVEEQQDSVSGSWLDGSAQHQFEKKLMDHSVSRTYLLRFRNQYQYTLFGKINANNIYKFGDYYFRFYIPSFNDASNFIGKDSIEHTLDEIVQLQHYLGDSIPVITIIPPSKHHYYQQFLPERNQTRSKETNYHYVLAGLKQKQLHHIDFNHYFLKRRYANKPIKPNIEKTPVLPPPLVAGRVSFDVVAVLITFTVAKLEIVGVISLS